jgi:hypothetical protein
MEALRAHIGTDTRVAALLISRSRVVAGIQARLCCFDAVLKLHLERIRQRNLAITHFFSAQSRTECR